MTKMQCIRQTALRTTMAAVVVFAATATQAQQSSTVSAAIGTSTAAPHVAPGLLPTKPIHPRCPCPYCCT
jgi:hypothetical protein